MLSCKDASRLLSQREDRALLPFERIRLRLHLLFCDACRRFGAQLRFMRRAMRLYRT
ncbi:MAG: zf-HC2 domain-containing protein [Rudaea sp.]